MKALTALAISAALLGGCAPSDQQKLLDTSKSAYEQGKNLATGAWQSFTKEAQSLDTNSTKEQLAEMRKKLSIAEGQAAHEGKKQADAIRDEAERIRLAEWIKDLEVQANDKMNDLKHAKDQATQGVQNGQKALDDANRAYDDAEKKLNQTKQLYDTATERAKAAWNAISGG